MLNEKRRLYMCRLDFDKTCFCDNFASQDLFTTHSLSQNIEFLFYISPTMFSFLKLYLLCFVFSCVTLLRIRRNRFYCKQCDSAGNLNFNEEWNFASFSCLYRCEYEKTRTKTLYTLTAHSFITAGFILHI